MAHVQPSFSESDLESVGHALEDAVAHRELPGLFNDSRLSEPVWEQRPPRWLRIKLALAQAQSESQTGNPVLRFISVALRPARFVQAQDRFEAVRERVNLQLAFVGLQFRNDGKF